MESEIFGSVHWNLGRLIQGSKLSKNKIAMRANIQRAQLTRYCNKPIQRIDLEVLARLCFTLNCSVADLLEYQPPKCSEQENEA